MTGRESGRTYIIPQPSGWSQENQRRFSTGTCGKEHFAAGKVFQQPTRSEKFLSPSVAMEVVSTLGIDNTSHNDGAYHQLIFPNIQNVVSQRRRGTNARS